MRKCSETVEGLETLIGLSTVRMLKCLRIILRRNGAKSWIVSYDKRNTFWFLNVVITE